TADNRRCLDAPKVSAGGQAADFILGGRGDGVGDHILKTLEDDRAESGTCPHLPRVTADRSVGIDNGAPSKSNWLHQRSPVSGLHQQGCGWRRLSQGGEGKRQECNADKVAESLTEGCPRGSFHSAKFPGRRCSDAVDLCPLRSAPT